MQMNFDTYDALIERYETKELKSEGYSFTERDLEMIKEYDHPEEFASYLIFLSTKPLIKEDATRLRNFMYEFIDLTDDEREVNENAK